MTDYRPHPDAVVRLDNLGGRQDGGVLGVG